jgi:hypothetical protein
MKIRKSDKHLFLLLTLFFFGFFFVRYSLTTGITLYPMGDLLINYSCGFIRRGLVGSILLRFSDIFKINVVTLANIVCFIIYGIVYGYIIKKLWRQPVLLSVIISSPLGFMFLIGDWVAYGFKDILILFFFLLSLTAARKSNFSVLYLVFIFLVLTGVFIHENFLFISVPFLLLQREMDILEKHDKQPVLLFVKRSLLNNSVFIGLVVLIGFTLFYTVMVGVNNQLGDCLKENFMSIAITSGIEVKKDSLFFLPLYWLNQDLAYAFDATSVNYKNTSNLANGLTHIVFLLVSVLFVYTKTFGIKAFVLIISRCVLSVVAITGGMMFLFLFATDWGRWMYLFFMHLILFVCVQQKEKQSVSFQHDKRFFVTTFTLLMLVLNLFIFIPTKYDSSNGYQGSFYYKIFESLFSLVRIKLNF